MEYIEIKGLPDKAALKAYKKGNFVEAIQIVHSWTENQAQQLVMLVGAVHFNADTSQTWDLTDTFSLNECLRILFILNQITKAEYSKFIELNKLRNKIVHQIYKESYNGEQKKVTKKLFDKVFNNSLDQIYFFTNKSSEIIEIPIKN